MVPAGGDKFVGTYLTDLEQLSTSASTTSSSSFTYFYVSITFNPDERADEMKKFGGFIPGIRPGLDRRLSALCWSRITLPGSIYLGVIVKGPTVPPQIGAGETVQNLPFGVLAVLIKIGVGLIRSSTDIASCSATTKGSSFARVLLLGLPGRARDGG